MTEKRISDWEFSKYSLQRNDEAIRFSEAKAALLLTLIGLLMGGIFINIEKYKTLLFSDILLLKTLAILSLLIIGIGFLLSIISTLAIIYPRTHVVKRTSFLFFDDNEMLSEDDIHKAICDLSLESQVDQIIAQVHATSKIAHKKFSTFRLSLIGIMVLLSGYLFSVFLNLFCL